MLYSPVLKEYNLQNDLGLIGSKRKIETLMKLFLSENILSKEELERIDMPIGIKFNRVLSKKGRLTGT